MIRLKPKLAAGLIIITLFSSVSAAPDWTISLRGAGPVRVGMTVVQVRRALNDPRAHRVGTPGDSLDTCSYLESSAVPEALGIMFLAGRVARMSVSQAGFRTASGAGVGDTEDRIKQLYPGRITVGPHPYVSGHYLTYRPADPADRGYGMIFETDGKKVTSFRAGTEEAIALIEGCS
jgi:hypothetical protein